MDTEIIRVLLIVGGLIGLGLAALKITHTRFDFGWLGALLIGVALLIQIVVKV